MGKEKMILVLMLVLVVMGNVAISQESLKNVVEQQGFAWMAGQWKATTENGQEIELAYQWAVKGHAIMTTFKMGENSSQGMIYLDADHQLVSQLSVDSRGRATKATWDVKDGKAIAKTQMTDEYGQTTDVAIAYSKIDSINMKVEVYGLENGQLSEYPWFEITFKKQKE